MKSIFIRFYEELNDFLDNSRKKIRFQHGFGGRPTIKDLIESLGVPHTEIDMILVNGRSVDFSYLVSDNDDISVYPVFESMDISGVQHLREIPLRNPCFVSDVHLGKLSRYMRMLGLDVKYRNNFNDNEIVNISIKEKRTILTRDAGILKRKEVTRGYYVRNIDPEKQAKEVILRFDLFSKLIPFSRCLNCNNVLKPAEKADIIEIIPPKVRNYKNELYICESCNKIYWQGSHFEKMAGLVKRLLSGNS